MVCQSIIVVRWGQGVVEVIDIFGELRRDNPDEPLVDLAILTDLLRCYVEASENVRRNGAVCAHPRTGQPIENPYLKVFHKCVSQMVRFEALATDRVLELLRGRSTHDQPENPLLQGERKASFESAT